MKSKKDNNQAYLENQNVMIVKTIAEEERLKCHVMKKNCIEKGSEMWKVKKKQWPNKASALPKSKINHQGSLVSTAAEIDSTMKKEYTERLRSRPKHPYIKKLFKAININYKLNMSKRTKVHQL